LHIPVALRVCPTVRESDGLALSSRNAYLAANQRNDALVLYTALQAGVNLLQSHPDASAATILAAARDRISKDLQVSQGRVSMEYLDLVHPDTLQLLSNTDRAQGGILVGAIRLKGEAGRIIRLIDNVIL
jgi:pantothenate synthetase